MNNTAFDKNGRKKNRKTFLDFLLSDCLKWRRLFGIVAAVWLPAVSYRQGQN